MSVPPEAAVTTNDARAARPGGQLIKATVVGAILAAALGWTLLSAALSLPFFLGLFFFMLFGMVIGAAMFRFAAPVRPVAKTRIMVMTALVSLVCWSVALGKECLEFPQDFASATLNNRSIHIPGGTDAYERVKGELSTFIDGYLEKHYPPGGAIGYLKLAAGGRPIEVDIPSQATKLTIAQRAPAWVWWTRVVLSLALVYLTVYAVTADLVKASDTPRPRANAATEPT